MRWVWRLLVVLATFAVTGFVTMHVLVAHAVAKGSPEYSVRLGGAMAGLFAGGAAATVIALVFVFGGRRTRLDRRD